MAFVLKINLDGDIRRKRFDRSGDLTSAKIDEFIMANFDFQDYVAKYRDDEGDLCTLTNATLADALDLASACNILHLIVSTPTQALCTSPSAVTCHVNSSEAATEAPQCSGAENAFTEPQQGAGLTWRGGGPRWLPFALKMMSRSGCLRADFATALITQWLPIINQRAIRKMEKLRVVGPHFVPQLAPAIMALSESIDCSEKLQPFRERLCRLVSEPGAVDIGMLVVDFLKTMVTEPFDLQCCIVEPVVTELLTLPCTQEYLQSSKCDLKRPMWSGPLLHHGVVCDICQVTPIEGPRFTCTSCADYDLCGTCYLKKGSFHSKEHAFETVLLPGKGVKGGKGAWAQGQGPWGKQCGGPWEKSGHQLDENVWGKGAGWGGWGKPHCFMKKMAKIAKLSHQLAEGAWGKGHGKGWTKGNIYGEEPCGKSKGKGKGWWKGASWLAPSGGEAYDWATPGHGSMYGHPLWWASPWAPWQPGWDATMTHFGGNPAGNDEAPHPRIPNTGTLPSDGTSTHAGDVIVASQVEDIPPDEHDWS